MTTHVLALDQGTTSTRCIVVDPSGTVVAHARVAHPPHHPRPGWVEEDPEELWEALGRCSAEAMGSAGLRPRDLAGVGLTNQRETTILWERASGRPLYPAIVWQDRRTSGTCRRLADEGAGPLVERRTGLVIDPYFSATKLAWLLDHVPDGRLRAARGELCFGTVDSWVAFRMSSGRRHVTEVTNASRTALMDLEGQRWDPELLELFAVPGPVLPEIVRGDEPLVDRSDAAGLRAAEGVALLAGLGDQQAALLGQGCVEAGQAKATFGTGTFVLGHCGAQLPAGRAGLLATAAASLDGTPRFALEGSILSSGSALTWLADELGVLSSVEESERVARSVEGDADVWFVPALAGLGSPYWDPRARGTLLGVTGATTKAHVVRAALEGVAHSVCDVLEAMGRAGCPVRALRVDGGAAANGWLIEQVCELSGVPVDVSAELESTAFGAAFLAGVRSGLWGEADLAALRRSRRTIEPAQDAARRQARRARWGQAVGRSLAWAEDSAS